MWDFIKLEIGNSYLDKEYLSAHRLCITVTDKTWKPFLFHIIHLRLLLVTVLHIRGL